MVGCQDAHVLAQSCNSDAPGLHRTMVLGRFCLKRTTVVSRRSMKMVVGRWSLQFHISGHAPSLM